VTCDRTFYYTRHRHTDGPQHTHSDVHSEDSVKKNIFMKAPNIKFHENRSVGNLVTPHREETNLLVPFNYYKEHTNTYLNKG